LALEDSSSRPAGKCDAEDQSITARKGIRVLFLSIMACLSLVLNEETSHPASANVEIDGLHEPVEIIKDRWGIAHIYARNQDDLFFAQGFNVASDRLFQLEMWRRQATGTVAEILGKKALQRDIGARLLKFRGDLRKELNFYHPQGEKIISAFVRGINAYIELTRQSPGLLPVEFRLLGTTPGPWTPEIVVSRHNGLFRNAAGEVRLAQGVRAAGPDKVEEWLDLHPGNPDLRPAEGIDLGSITDEIIALYEETRSPIRFSPEDIVDSAERASSATPGAPAVPWAFLFEAAPSTSQGSNNWAVCGRLTRSGFPLLANDPHRALQIPSLRYWVHLSAPGWNVIGGGEPALPGVSIGHNDYGAWGLTIFSADQEDLYVYETDPENSARYRYSDDWEEMTTVREKTPVKDAAPVEALLKFTRHGPVIFEDAERHQAVALRASWLEVGCAPYLSSLRMDQARAWPEFQAACFNNRTPSENMVWADRKGNIGWQATGLVPVRPNWPGLLPVPGDGRFEWAGFLPASELPSLHNPESGFIATANQDNLPEDYPHQVGFQWADPFRFLRISEVLGSGRKLSLSEMMDLQQDVLSLPARRLVPLLKDLLASTVLARTAMGMLEAWDCVLSRESAAAAIYIAWERAVLENLKSALLPGDSRPVLRQPPLLKAIGWLEAPDRRFGPNPEAERNQLLVTSFEQGVEFLVKTFGADPAQWHYGDPGFHHVRLRHPLSAALKENLGAEFDLGPLPRGGDGQTVNNTTDGDNQTSGATFRIIADPADWDRSLGTNSPGQSGDPKNPHYSDLFSPWAEGKYFPVYFTRAKIESVAEKTIRLKPAKRKRHFRP
jgi:penicillin amidase